MSGRFFHAREPSSEHLPEKLASKSNRQNRTALAERTSSQLNTDNAAEYPTIRLVEESSSPNNAYDKTPFPQKPSQVLNPPRTSKHGYTVQSDTSWLNPDLRPGARSASPSQSSKRLPTPLTLRQPNRFSAATTVSNCDTLINDSLFSPTSNRWSAEGTLRNTPTPQEMEERARERAAELEALDEAPERTSTIRPVSASSSSERAPGSSDSNEMPVHPAFRTVFPPRGRLSSIISVETPTGSAGPASGSHRSGGPSSEYSAQFSTSSPIAQSSSSRNFVRHGSESSQNFVRHGSESSSFHPQTSSSQNVIAYDNSPSSPNAQSSSSQNFVTYGSSGSSPNARTSGSYNIVTYGTSEDSASVQYPNIRPVTAGSQSVNSDWSTTNSDSLPPLTVPRRRMHMHSASAGANFIPTRPLSTIDSEREPSSRINTRLSRFSNSSGDVLRQSSRGTQPMQHRRAQTIASSSYTSASNLEMNSSDNSQNDLTNFSLIRAESALPEPLFSSSSRQLPARELPDSTPSKDTEGEGDDTIVELRARPPLRGKRSGPLSRRRSMSDPPPPGSSRSNHTEMVDRTSQGSSIFPQWAKQFYRGRSVLASASASRTSLSRSDSQNASTRSPMRMRPWARHHRFDSEWESYDTSGGSVFDSRPGTTRSAFSHSPGVSSHFLPSIFRPYARQRAYTDITASGTHFSDEFYQESNSSHDSLEIRPAPPVHPSGPAYQPSPLGSPPPRKHSHRQPRNKGKQRAHHGAPQPDTLPRSGTFASSTLGYPSASLFPATSPHLAPSRRLSNRISAWRAPSFDEALNTLFISRQNRQILFFCLGFLCPLSWMVAAFLPIPPRPFDPRINEMSIVGEEDLQTEAGRFQLDVQMDMFDWELQRSYLKAKWWRTLNRVMSFVGVGVIAAIVSFLTSHVFRDTDAEFSTTGRSCCCRCQVGLYAWFGFEHASLFCITPLPLLPSYRVFFSCL